MEGDDTMDIKQKINAVKAFKSAKTGQIKLDESVVSSRYFSPAEKYIVPTADPFVISKYNQFDHKQRDKIIQDICLDIARGKSKMKACEGSKMDYQTLKFWMKTCPEYAEWVKDAEDDRYEALFEETIDIADDVDDDGATVSENIAKAKLRISARQHLTGKARPDKYGVRTSEKKEIDISIKWEEKKTYYDDSIKLDEYQENVQDIPHEEVVEDKDEEDFLKQFEEGE